eukprot:scaffold121496_cov75-Phaeocystis_antarctica.AAC.1
MADGGDDEQVDQEFTQQRQYMERALGALKTRVGRTEEKTQQDFQKKVGENTMLIKECNALRTDNKDLKYQNAQLHTELQQQSRSGAQAPMRRQPSAGALRPSTAGRLGSESLPSMRADSGGARGQLLKGSASVSGRERAKMAEMLVAQNQSRTEVEMQRSEIQRLREQARSHACIHPATPGAITLGARACQVHSLLERSGESVAHGTPSQPDDRPRTSHEVERGTAEDGSPEPNVGMPRASSALR